MATNSIITTKGKNVALYRTYTENGDLSATQYLAPSVFSIGISQTTPLVADTALDVRVPIENGTVNDDGDNQLTGSSGGTNTTDNTTTFKEGGGVTDATAQNLIANDTNASKIWTIADLDTNGNDIVGTKPYSLWLYIKDATALAKFVSAGTALSIKFRTNGDGATLYYEDAYEDGDLSTGWNYITSNTTNVEDLTEGAGGPPSGDLDEFVITITTNNATDEFAAGDVIYDLLRQWAASDLINSFVATYPTFDYINNEVEIQGFLNSLKGNGFLVTGFALYNEDTTPLMTDLVSLGEESKSSTDEFTFIVRNRII